MDEATKFIIQIVLTTVSALLAIWFVDRRKAMADFKRAEADKQRAGGDEGKSLSESAAILADTSADLGKSWQEYATRANLEFTTYRDHAEQMINDLRKELEEHKRKSNEDTANQNAVIFDLTAQIATLKRENTDLRKRVVELEAENSDLRGQYPRRTLGSK